MFDEHEKNSNLLKIGLGEIIALRKITLHWVTALKQDAGHFTTLKWVTALKQDAGHFTTPKSKSKHIHIP